MQPVPFLTMPQFGDEPDHRRSSGVPVRSGAYLTWLNQVLMTEQQKIAMDHHCRFAFETAQPRFYRASRDASVAVTVNSGYE